MNIKRNILANFGQLENEIPSLTNQHVNWEFLECEIAKNISKMALCPGTVRKKLDDKSPVLMKVHKYRYENFSICSSLYFKTIFKKILLKFDIL